MNDVEAALVRHYDNMVGALRVLNAEFARAATHPASIPSTPNTPMASTFNQHDFGKPILSGPLLCYMSLEDAITSTERSIARTRHNLEKIGLLKAKPAKKRRPV